MFVMVVTFITGNLKDCPMKNYFYYNIYTVYEIVGSYNDENYATL